MTDSLEHKIDKLTIMMGKVVTKDEGQKQTVQTMSLSNQ